MPFNARPNLNNEQFRQTVDSVLTLSGQTQIVSPSGLTLTDGQGGYIPIIATGGTDFDVLTYCNGKITLEPAKVSGSGVYSGASPTTCTVGGLNSGSNIYGCAITDILQKILVPTLNPTLSAPSSTFSINPATTTYEVGVLININGTTSFNRGSISPAYGTSGFRSGLPTSYEYTIWGIPSAITSTQISNNAAFTPHTVVYGVNSVSSRVNYSAGEQPLDSEGNTYDSALLSGSTAFNNIVISGIYPYFYGKIASGGLPAGQGRPVASASLITNGTKVVAASAGNISVTFNSTSDDYIWFAIPEASASKTKWFVDALNNGSIGGVVSPGGNLFPDFSLISNVSTTYWNSQKYKVYISNYQTAAKSMELRNN